MQDRSGYPEGTDFLQQTFAMERACERTTDRAIPEMGNLASDTWVQLGTCFSLLGRLSTCYWGCGGGDHSVERLVLRALNSLRAAVRLMRAGFYDEALNALRTAGEVVNLLELFQYDVEACLVWRRADAEERWRQASPGRVRERLEELGHASLLDRDRYAQLSQIVHATETRPSQAHNPFDVPMAGGHFQPGGFIVALNEAAMVTALLILPATGLIPLSGERWERLHQAAELLVENTDFVGMQQVADTHAEYRNRHVAPELDRLMEQWLDRQRGVRQREASSPGAE